MQLETKRLLLRPWRESDAGWLYAYAKDPRIGPITGFPPHQSVENSRQMIKAVLSVPHTFALVLKEKGEPVGSIGLTLGSGSSLRLRPDEGEIGYWIGVPYWGRGLMPEAIRALLRYGFEQLQLTKIWCGYFDGNERSRRAQEKCGFRYHHTIRDMVWKPMNDIRTEHVTCLTREDWRKGRSAGR